MWIHGQAGILNAQKIKQRPSGLGNGEKAFGEALLCGTSHVRYVLRLQPSLNPGFCILLVLLIALAHGKYVAGFRERLGILFPLDNQKHSGYLASLRSVGEAQHRATFGARIRTRLPTTRLFIEHYSDPGQNLPVRFSRNDAAKVFYFPFDWHGTVRVPSKRSSSAVLIMETELWPGFPACLRKARIPVAIRKRATPMQSFRRTKTGLKGFVRAS